MSSSEKPRNSSNSSTSGSRRKPSRLQQRAPASLQIKPTTSSQWNVAIPLLSPLAATSPTSPRDRSTTTAETTKPTRKEESVSGPQKKTTVVFKKWQHPAAPFGYDQATVKKHPFVPV